MKRKQLKMVMIKRAVMAMVVEMETAAMVPGVHMGMQVIWSLRRFLLW